MKNLFSELENIFKQDERFISQDGKLMRNAIYEAANKMDEKLLTALITNESIKKAFFKEINGVLVFDKQEFSFVINNRELLPDSYTRFKQKIGLVDSKNEFIVSKNDVVLSFPFKDCLLEFDSTDPNKDRKEIFFNEVLAYDKIDNLLDKKVFTNVKSIDKIGEREMESFDDKSNLLIKGNNLLAMHSLLPRYRNQIKLMYWDVLYNTDSDKVPYADSFKHSSWLVMMKNRLEVAKQLLKDDGVICIQCDDNEMAYLKVLCDEIMQRNNLISCIVVESGGTLFGTKVAHVDKTFVKQKDYILVYAKNSDLVKIEPLFDIIEPFDTHYNKIIISPIETYSLLDYMKSNSLYTEKFEKYNIDMKAENISTLIKIDEEFAKDFYKNIAPILYQDCPYTNSISDEKLHELKNNNIVSIDGTYVHMTSGGKCRFYKSFKDCLNIADDYKMTFGRTGYRGDLWKGFGEDMKNVEDEGSVELKNGKKPERLIANLLKALTNKNDIILDAYFGTGTTGAVVMKMGRQFIGIEQLDSHIKLAKERLINVINGDETGISKQVGWQGGGSFVYCELKKLNQEYIEKIKFIENKKELSKLAIDILHSDFISCNIDVEKVVGDFQNVEDLEIDDLKKILIELLDKNQLYVNYSDIDDEEMNVSDDDKKFTKTFYGEE